MRYKTIIIKILNILMWVGITSAVVVLLISAVQNEKKQNCKDVKIAFTDNKPFRMLEESEVINTLWPTQTNSYPVGKSIMNVSLYSLEKQLKNNPWVLDANLYFDQQNILHIEIKQRNPIARIFSPEGNSFYLDDSLFLLPLKASGVLDLPVFTNFKITPAGTNSADSLIMNRILGLALFIQKDPFWMAQVEQIYINQHGGFEMTTQVGDQSVVLGTESNWQEMFSKLKRLYQYFGTESEWSKYRTIDLQFNDQVVCGKGKMENTGSDSVMVEITNRNVNIDTVKLFKKKL